MSKPRDKVVRFDAELFEDAVAEGRSQSRSATQQLDHWARVGRAVSSTTSASRRRVEEALAGHLPMMQLTSPEGVVFNAEITANVELLLDTTHYGDRLAAEGITTVALDQDGQLVQHLPDGSTSILSPARS